MQGRRRLGIKTAPNDGGVFGPAILKLSPVADIVGVLMRKGVAGAGGYIYAYMPRAA